MSESPVTQRHQRPEMDTELVPLRVDLWRVGAWLLFMIVVGLGGRYLGGALQPLRFALLFTPLLSLVWLAVTAGFLRYHQEFSGDHPKKGSQVQYRLNIKNESRLPACSVTLRLYTGAHEAGLETVTVYPVPGAPIAIDRTVFCSVRGVYELGLAGLWVNDPLAMVSWRLPVWHRTFYVAPRVLQPDRGLMRPVREMPGAEKTGGPGREDVTLFRELGEYREGVDVRRIAWKHFAAVGTPVIRVFDSAVDEKVRIILDTRPSGKGNSGVNTAVEDTSIELAVALAAGAVRDRIPATLERYGAEPVEITSTGAVERFVADSVGIFFRAPAGPLEVASASRGEGDTPIICVTHRADPMVIERISGDYVVPPLGVIFNAANLSVRERENLTRLSRELTGRGRLCLVVDNADEIAEGRS